MISHVREKLCSTNQMKALCYADVQATDGHEKCHGDPTVPLQIARVDALYGRLLDIYKEHKCDCLWDLGDTTDDRSSIPVPAIRTVCSNLKLFPRNEWDLKLIGNHEQFLRNTEIHVGDMFSPYFTVVEKNEAFDCGDTRILVCSFPANERDTIAWLQDQRKAAKGRKVIFLGHFQVLGSITGGGQLLAGIPKEELTWVDLGLLGHVHKPQSVLKKVHYVGSPFQQDWGESGEEKRVGIVDVLNATVEWVAMDGFPQYLKVNVDEFKEMCDQETEDRFKVILRTPEEAAKFYALPLAHRAEPVYDFDVTDATPDANDEGKITGKVWTFDSVLRRYAENNTPESKGIPATVDEILEIGHDIAKR